MTAVAEVPAASAPVAAEATTSEEVALERATKWANEYAARLTERTMSRLAEVAGHSNGVQAQIGEPTTGSPATGFYVAFDVAATSPIQFGGPPPYQPSKVIAAGQSAFIVAFIYVNPTVNIPLGWAVPASIQLGGRTWRMTLDQGNLTTGTVLPRQVTSPPSVARRRAILAYPGVVRTMTEDQVAGESLPLREPPVAVKADGGPSAKTPSQCGPLAP